MFRTFFSAIALAGLLFSCTPSEEQIARRAARIHAAVATVDSHTDTPMWFTREGFDFGERHDPLRDRNRVDLPRMNEGGLDGIFMAVFVGQRDRTPEGNLRAKQQAYETTAAIHEVIQQYPDDLELALTSKDLERIERAGKRAIYIGLENGYPIGDDLSLVDTFYNKGIRYITLCHSYNNDICDSSTDSTEHNGLSPFGEKVVSHMNDLGVMIDVSHISDSSFYDVIEVSKAPVIASHSCARALCDNPRNLSDEMLLKLKENGGVIQMCILSNYVKPPVPNPERDSARRAVYLEHGNYYELDSEGKAAFLDDWYQVDVDFPPILATVSDVVDHIDHIVEVAGIDHVGIGTDFDGGGGVEGCYDVSEMGNITLELVRRGYSRKEIEKIWSGNLMRVMKAVEKARI